MESPQTDDDELAKIYGSQIEEQMRAEAQRRIDENHDDKNERFRGHIIFPSNANQVENVQLFVFFNYGLRVRILECLIL